MKEPLLATGFISSLLRLSERELNGLSQGIRSSYREREYSAPRYEVGDFVEWNRPMAEVEPLHSVLEESITQYGEGPFEVLRIMMPTNQHQSPVAAVMDPDIGTEFIRGTMWFAAAEELMRKPRKKRKPRQ